MKFVRACLDWRVLSGLAVVGVGAYLVAPGLLLAVLPFLLAAACPLSMLLMMRAMNGQPADGTPASGVTASDREAALRSEVAELATRQQQLIMELRDVASRREVKLGSRRAPGRLP